MTPDELYAQGYEDGKKGKAANAALVNETNYSAGYTDGKGDRERNQPAGEGYAENNDPPLGFAFTGEKRVPNAYEWYLSKGGGATYLARERKNNQTRHILIPDFCICDTPGGAKKCGLHSI